MNGQPLRLILIIRIIVVVVVVVIIIIIIIITTIMMIRKGWTHGHMWPFILIIFNKVGGCVMEGPNEVRQSMITHQARVDCTTEQSTPTSAESQIHLLL